MSRAGRPKGAEAKLDRETIEIAALALLDQGQAAFSMRALGAALSVTPMALYHHVGGREALIGTLADRVLEDVTAGEGSASERVAGLLQAYCRAVVAHPALFLMLFDTPAAFEGGPQRVTAELDTLLAEAMGAAFTTRVRDILIDYTHGYGFAVAVNGTEREAALTEYSAALALLLEAFLPSGGTPARR
ncbi:MAG: hypothetical protein BGN86_09650 [Caulobacterales bacterium 68-7]|nr:TetR/AcrR family transcriptional regulator [Caulobacterales bacterium]OJU11009.1 MAG: hypothetical protein BGN86_09650 [Caulobacterales bacterium 68-7]